VSFYSQVVVPRLCDFLLNKSLLARQRRALLAAAHGDVLEIGFGTGLNLPYYPQGVHKVSAVDPNPGMHRLAQKRIKKTRIEVDQHVLGGERLPFGDGTFDCAVSTFTLCSIEDVAQAVREVYRVLKPGGKFLFLEHGLSPEPGVQKWQRRLNGLQVRLANGCHLDRDIKALVAAQPFASVEVEEFYLERTPRTHGYLYRGVATK
jgi:ubiquinone/menaquinone biosynthesis C-methylase UbiE